jgi:hypothetical protein
VASPAHTPLSRRRAPKRPAPAPRRSVSSGKRNSGAGDYVTLGFGCSKTWRLEGRGGPSQTPPGAEPASPSAPASPPRLLPGTPEDRGSSPGKEKGGCLFGPYPRGAEGRNVRGLNTGETRRVRAAVWRWRGAVQAPRKRRQRNQSLDTWARSEGREGLWRA